jgi:hypothetical protein
MGALGSINSTTEIVEASEFPNSHNLNASVAPTATDDSGSGYVVGSRWIDTTADKEYVCVDATATAAVWTETTVGASPMTATAQSTNYK